ncbi:MAG: IS256 family transposase [Gammaproteobacteria bacterium]
MAKDRTGLKGSAQILDWMDPLEEALREGVQSYLRELLELEVTTVLGRLRYGRQSGATGYRNGHRRRELVSTLGRMTVAVPRARVVGAQGSAHEFRSALLPRCRHLTNRALSVIAGAYLAGVNTRRVRRALASLFGGPVSRDTVSRAWHKVQTDFTAWNERRLEAEPIVRLILDGTVVKLRLDHRVTALGILVALGVRADGQKVLLALKAMGGESEAAWRALLEGLIARGLAPPELLVVDGGQGLHAALTALWPEVPVQRCTVHKLRNLLAHVPRKLQAELAADYTDMIYAKTAPDVQAKRKAFLRKWRLKCRSVAESLEEAGAELFTFLRYPTEQWRSLRTTNAIERLHEEFKRRIKTQCALPSADAACMLYWALVASGEITLRRVDGWQHLTAKPAALDLAA